MKEWFCGLEAALMLKIAEGMDTDCILREEGPQLTSEAIAEARSMLERLREMIARLEILITDASQESIISIHPDYKIYHNETELHLRPLPKTLFLFFLKHPEGIEFKELSAHKKELSEIYHKLCPNLRGEQVKLTIERLVDPSSNSLDTSRWMLGREFLSQLDAETARLCSISGGRGQKKRVLIDRARVKFL